MPALLLYRSELALRDRFALAVYCATELPLVVAITTLAIEAGHMETSTAAGLVGAAIISTLIFPLLGARIRRGGEPAAGPIERRRLPSGRPWPRLMAKPSVDELEVLRQPAEVAVAVRGDHDQVLDPDAEAARAGRRRARR